ncbi:MAG: thioredoxin [Gammaproteobacteria bacterium]|nr:thioredoxin [Gammaproteobacteria bacterium]
MTANNWVFQVTAEEFSSKVLGRSHELPVLVDFWAEWCAPCKMLMPVLARLADEAGGKWLLAKVNTDIEQELAMTYQVRSLPTVKLFRNGDPVDEFMGALPESEIRRFIDPHIERESDRLAATARRLFAAGDQDQALATMERALQDDPDNPRVVFERLKMLLDAGDYPEVEQGLGTLPISAGDSPEAKKLRAELRFRQVLASEDGGSRGARQQAARLLVDGDYKGALELLIGLLRTNPGLEDGAPKDDLLAAFELVPDADLIAGYRRQMFNLLH